jgi:hypothetical protein
MSDEQRKRILEAIEAYTALALASPEAARAALIREGIYTNAGELSHEFGGPPPAPPHSPNRREG